MIRGPRTVEILSIPDACRQRKVSDSPSVNITNIFKQNTSDKRTSSISFRKHGNFISFHTNKLQNISNSFICSTTSLTVGWSYYFKAYSFIMSEFDDI